MMEGFMSMMAGFFGAGHDCIGSDKSNYHTITITTAPSSQKD
jgi:hypothetical protein